MARRLTTLDFTVIAGRAFELTFTWGEEDTDTGVVTPLNPTGYILRIQARRNAASDTVVLSFSSVVGDSLGGAEGTVTLLGAVTNNVTLAMTAAESQALFGQAGAYKYDCQWGPNSDEPFFTGTITVVDEITR